MQGRAWVGALNLVARAGSRTKKHGNVCDVMFDARGV